MIFVSIIHILLLFSFLQNEAVLKACAEPPPSKTSMADTVGAAEKDSTNSVS